jgi:aspartyl-tRNA synthetase
LRNPLIIQDATDLFGDSGFSVYDTKVKEGEKIRAIVLPQAGDKPRSFFDKVDAFAKESSMGGIAYIAFSSSGTKGLSKILSEEKVLHIKNVLGANDGDAIVFAAGALKQITRFSGIWRNKLGHELDLFEKDSFCLCWIVDFPFYEQNEETGAVEFSHNPFSMPQGGMDALLNKNPLDIVAYQYDLVCNGVELASGAVRNHKPEIMYKAFEIAGYGHDVVDSKFGGMINAFHYGAPPHAGAAPGVDRTVMLILDEPIIRDVIAFPLNGKAQDLLMQAPNTASEAQLKELHIKLDLEDDK